VSRASSGRTEIRVAGSGAAAVFADPQDVFRILFNLAHNALSVARERAGTAQPMTNVTLLFERRDTTVTLWVADDGPGLPNRYVTGSSAGNIQQPAMGWGLAIARELAERNGGVLQHVETRRGATFLLQLAAAGGFPAEPGALRSLGKSVRH
jgi:signal transduction histidine kinase